MTTPQPGGYNNNATCIQSAHAHTVHTRTHTRVCGHDGWPSPLGIAQMHYPSPSGPEERDALLPASVRAQVEVGLSVCFN